jgi:hypothetical protein
MYKCRSIAATVVKLFRYSGSSSSRAGATEVRANISESETRFANQCFLTLLNTPTDYLIPFQVKLGQFIPLIGGSVKVVSQQQAAIRVLVVSRRRYVRWSSADDATCPDHSSRRRYAS